jgi:para-nitrobenzyl esterase
MREKRYLAYICVFLLLVLAFTMVTCSSEQTTKTTTLEEPQLDSGPISGIQEGDIWVYKGIPFAAPPVGELRWKEPQPVESWDEVRPCTEFGPACSQPTSDDWGGFMTIGETSEDCLYLNIWTPAESPDERLPVMFWIHGGAFRTGSGSQAVYDGVNMAGNDVIIVTINYRLGPFGFFAHPLLTEESPNNSSGNYGLLDQIAALEWVERNIEAFGGDPDNVTVFGESAGAMSIYSLMASPLAEGLFDGAIMQSGPFLDMGLPLNPDDTLENAEEKGEEVSEELGCEGVEDELACLRDKSPEELMQASDRGDDPLAHINLGPNTDGWVLPDSPSAVFAAGEQYDVPVIVGSNADDGSIFVPDIDLQQSQLLVSFLYGDYAEQVEALFPAETEEQVWQATSDLITEMGFAATARFIAASMQDKGSDAFLYLFSRIPDDERAEGLGAFHGLEIVYVFGNFDKVGLDTVDQTDTDLSKAMMDYWVTFAKTGDPNSSDVLPWPFYAAEDYQYQNLGDYIIPETGFYDEAYNLMLEFTGSQ